MKGVCVLLLLLPLSCVPIVRNDPTSTDLYGLEVGLVRTYRSRFPICGKAHDHFMEKRVVKELSLPGARAAVVEVRLGGSVALHGLPSDMREVFAETRDGFGYYSLKDGGLPAEADAKRIELELPKPFVPGTRRKFEAGEIIVEAVEDVVVAAGKFVGCVRVRFQFEGTANLCWFAPGVGMVRLYSEKRGNDGRAAMEYELIRLIRPSRS